ncbi:dynamin family protein [Aerosakkonema funiforme]|uniref:dynamin family protein n=1 Tax=Aerosakkonema funiforme TaxID=1246630 RepID=UPI0035B7E243
MSFVDYNKMVLTLVADLEKLRSSSEKLKLTNSVELIDEVLKRIKSNSFSVAVVGEFKRGKSTFINALLGEEILPSDILPCSATLNRVKYGISPLVTVIFKDGRQENIPIDKLKDYVAKLTPESEKTAETVQEAVVEYPVPYCRNNIEIIDTPGLNDYANMTEVTLSVLPQVDAAILVIMAQSPFGEFERDFLENKLLTHDLGRVIFVVTGIDRFNRPEDADRVIDAITTRISQHVIQRAKAQFGEGSTKFDEYVKKIGKPKIFGLSPYQYLEGNRLKNSALIAESRFEDFTVALEKFLTEERGTILLQVPVNRAIASSMEIISTISILLNALQMKQEEFQQAYETSVTEIEALRQRKKEEMQLIDKAADNIKYRVRPLIWQLPNELKQAAEKAIDDTNIEPRELNKRQALQEKMGNKVCNAVQNASGRLSEKIQMEIQEGVDREVERLQDFAKSVDLALKRIEMKFVQIEGNIMTRRNNATVEAIVAALSVFIGFGGIWGGYRVAGIKGALAGAGASVATIFVTAFIVAVVGAPVTLPLVIGTTIVSFFTADWFAKAVFSQEQVKTFKANYKAKVLEAIDKELRQDLENSINNQITDLFGELKQTLQKEVEALLDNTQGTLADLRAKREKNIVLSEAERRELSEIRAETERIFGNAERLSKQLVEVMSV